MAFRVLGPPFFFAHDCDKIEAQKYFFTPPKKKNTAMLYNIRIFHLALVLCFNP